MNELQKLTDSIPTWTLAAGLGVAKIWEWLISDEVSLVITKLTILLIFLLTAGKLAIAIRTWIKTGVKDVIGWRKGKLFDIDDEKTNQQKSK